MEVLKEILTVLMNLVIIPAVPLITVYVVNAFKQWADSKAIETDNATASEYIMEITDIISQAVISTSQTYVDSLKAQGKFDAEAQKIAFEKTKSVVLRLLAEDAVDFIAKMYGDVDLWLDTKIEQMVSENKNQQNAVLIAEA